LLSREGEEREACHPRQKRTRRRGRGTSKSVIFLGEFKDVVPTADSSDSTEEIL
jgi:hypothetical protein